MSLDRRSIPSIEVTDDASNPRPTAAARWWALAVVSGLALALAASAALLVSYVSFKYPIKWDRHRHRFSERIVDRATAYALLLRSPSRGANAVMTLESVGAIVRGAAERHGIEPCLVMAIVTFESNFNPNTVTTTGAMGLMALQPETARVLGVEDPFDPRQNVDGGTRQLLYLSAAFDQDVETVLAGYNAGPNVVRRYSGVPPYRETREYIRQVGTLYDLCRAHRETFLGGARAR